MNKMNASKITYLILRYFLIFVGIFIIIGTYSNHFIMPGLYYDAGPIPPMRDRLCDIFLPLFYATLLILPHRYTIKNLTFSIKMSLLLVASFWLVYAGLLGILNHFQSGKHWLIIPTSIVFLFISVIAPFSLWIKRKIHLE